MNARQAHTGLSMADGPTLGGLLLPVKQALNTVSLLAGPLTLCPAPRW